MLNTTIKENESGVGQTKNNMVGVASDLAVLQLYSIVLQEQSDINLTLVPELAGYLAAAKVTAKDITDNLTPLIQHMYTRVAHFCNVFDVKKADLIQHITDGDKDALNAVITDLNDQINSMSNINDIIRALQVTSENAATDAGNFAKAQSGAAIKYQGDAGEIVNLQDAITTINNAISVDNDKIAGRTTEQKAEFGAGAAAVAVGIATIPFGGLVLIVGGAVAIGIGIKEVTDAKKDIVTQMKHLKTKTDALHADKAEMAALQHLGDQVMILDSKAQLMVAAGRNLANQWISISADFDNITGDLNIGDPSQKKQALDNVSILAADFADLKIVATSLGQDLKLNIESKPPATSSFLSMPNPIKSVELLALHNSFTELSHHTLVTKAYVNSILYQTSQSNSVVPNLPAHLEKIKTHISQWDQDSMSIILERFAHMNHVANVVANIDVDSTQDTLLRTSGNTAALSTSLAQCKQALDQAKQETDLALTDFSGTNNQVSDASKILDQETNIAVMKLDAELVDLNQKLTAAKSKLHAANVAVGLSVVGTVGAVILGVSGGLLVNNLLADAEVDATASMVMVEGAAAVEAGSAGILTPIAVAMLTAGFIGTVTGIAEIAAQSQNVVDANAEIILLTGQIKTDTTQRAKIKAALISATNTNLELQNLASSHSNTYSSMLALSSALSAASAKTQALKDKADNPDSIKEDLREEVKAYKQSFSLIKESTDLLKDILINVKSGKRASHTDSLASHGLGSTFFSHLRPSSVNLSGHGINDANLVAVLHQLRPNVRVLNLSNNRLSDTSVMLLARFMAHNRSLQKLDLSNNQMSKAGNDRLSSLIESNTNTTITELVLGPDAVPSFSFI